MKEWLDKMSYPIIICEDNLTQLQQMRTIIDNYILFHDELFEVKIATQSPDELIKYIKKFDINKGIYFLDIDLSHQLNGIDIAKIIRGIDVEAKIIFVTTHNEMAPITFKEKVEALDFIMKDQPIEELRAAIYSALEESQKRIDLMNDVRKNNFSFSISSQTYNLELSEVVLIETSTIPHRLDLYSKKGKYEFYGNLIDLELMYPSLLRLNRSCLVNPQNIKQVDYSKRSVCLQDDILRTFSLGKSKKIKEAMKTI